MESFHPPVLETRVPKKVSPHHHSLSQTGSPILLVCSACWPSLCTSWGFSSFSPLLLPRRPVVQKGESRADRRQRLLLCWVSRVYWWSWTEPEHEKSFYEWGIHCTRGSLCVSEGSQTPVIISLFTHCCTFNQSLVCLQLFPLLDQQRNVKVTSVNLRTSQGKQ